MLGFLRRCVILAGVGLTLVESAGAETCCVVMPVVAPPAPAQPGAPAPLITAISPIAGASSVPPLVPPLAPLPSPVVAPGVSTGGVLPVAGRPVTRAMPVALGVYTVQKGARLWVVAKRTGTRFADLILLNPKLEIDRKLPAGTRVMLPIAGSW